VTLNNPQTQDNPPPAPPGYQTVPVRIPSITPYVTYGLLGITILVFLLQLGTKSLLGYDLPAALGLKDNGLIAQGQYWRLFTPLFLHSTSMLLHVVFNMYALFAFGPSLERYYGHVGFILLYFLAGFTGNVLSFIFSAAPSLGASTAIFGLVGAEAVFLYRNRKLLGNRAQGALINLLVIVALNFVLGLSSGFVGICPNFQVVNTRSPQQTYLVGAAIFVLFAALAGITIIWRG
jgi:rhomboid protease GluP